MSARMILGVDPALGRTGWALLSIGQHSSFAIVAWGPIAPRAGAAVRSSEAFSRNSEAYLLNGSRMRHIRTAGEMDAMHPFPRQF